MIDEFVTFNDQQSDRHEYFVYQIEQNNTATSRVKNEGRSI